ncbi:putative lipoprotein [Leptospira sp. P2653]|nr:putative lipoprotein [Leptospira sp. P2653]
MFQKMFLTLLTGSVVLTLYSCEDKKEDNMGTLFFLLSASGGLGSSQTPRFHFLQKRSIL